jgi:hypothetical protein
VLRLLVSYEGVQRCFVVLWVRLGSGVEWGGALENTAGTYLDL